MNSLSHIAWRKFKKNSLGVFGLIIITIAVVISFLGYVIFPDSTPYSNQMHLELSKKEPGFTTVFILVPKESVPEVNLFEKMLFGQESQFEEIPISTYREDNGVLWYTPFDSQY